MFLTSFKSFIVLTALIVFVTFSSVICQSSNTSGSFEETTVPTTTPSQPPKTTTPIPPKNESCEFHNKDCKGCVASSQCFYCETDEKCRYKITKVLSDDECALKKIHYLTCRVNFQYLMIGIGVFAGIALLIITVVCCYCCCKKKNVKISKTDLKLMRQREERKQIAAEKRKERAERTEEIRKKYGLVKDSNPYQKFDA